jgi:hypothetical protein
LRTCVRPAAICTTNWYVSLTSHQEKQQPDIT